jgi:hypothetical protein
VPMTVLDPTTESEAEPLALAPSPGTLEGRTIGLLDNGKANAAGLLGHVEVILREAHHVREVVRLRKPDFSRPAPASLVVRLAECDAVITGVGD